MSESAKPILCLDFDGVLHSYVSGWQGAAMIPDPPVDGAMEFIVRASERFRVAIFSSRSCQPGGVEAMQGWVHMSLTFYMDTYAEADEIFSRIEWPREKPPAFLTIDDRAVTFNGVWPDLAEIASFQPWTKRPPVTHTDIDQQITAAIHKYTEDVPLGTLGDGGEFRRAINAIITQARAERGELIAAAGTAASELSALRIDPLAFFREAGEITRVLRQFRNGAIVADGADEIEIYACTQCSGFDENNTIKHDAGCVVPAVAALLAKITEPKG